MLEIKICGLTTLEAIDASADAGANLVGFVHHRSSPRHVPLEALGALTAHASRLGLASVAVLVDPEDALLDQLPAELDWVQLHGAETPERVAEMAAGRPWSLIKAAGVSTRADIEALDRFAAADRLLLDAKPPRAPATAAAAREGGHGIAFDWSLLQASRPTKPWFLAGGLTPLNVETALRLTGASGVDVSSGVESAPGVKDLRAIAAFVAAARRGADDRLNANLDTQGERL